MKIDKEELGNLAESAAFLKQIVNIVRIESVHNLETQDTGNENQCYVIQYKTAIYVYNRYGSD